MTKRTFYLVQGMLLLLAVLTSCSGKGDKSSARDAVTVKVMEVGAMQGHASDDTRGASYSGTIEEQSGTSVSFATMGTVKRVCVENGQTVSKGQLLAELDATTLQNSYNAAQSMLRQAQDAYARMKKLHDTNSISDLQWVEVESKVEQAKSAEQIARRALQDARLTAPASGVISNKTLETGQNVTPGISVMKIVGIDRVKACMSVPEQEVGTIRKGMAVSIIVSALGNEVFHGKVTELDVVANSLSRSYNVKADITNPGKKLMPGMICTAMVMNGAGANSATTIPLAAVQLSDKNFYFVWTVKDGKAHKRTIEVGSMTSDGVAVTSGLQMGDKVIVEGQQKVSENMKVKVQ